MVLSGAAGGARGGKRGGDLLENRDVYECALTALNNVLQRF